MDSNHNSKFIIIFIVLLLLLLGLIFLLIRELQVTADNAQKEIVAAVDEDNSVENILINNNCELLRRDISNRIAVNFPLDLYNTDGTSNELYFEKLVSELIPVINSDFTLVDNSKSIKISIVYDYTLKEYTIMYNDVENFYANTDGKSYIAVDTVEITRGTMLYEQDYYLSYLIIQGCYFSSIKDKLGEGVEKSNKYVDYLDGTLSIRTAPNDAVKNMVFKKGYKTPVGTEIMNKVTMDTPLSEIYQNFPRPDFGSVDKGYLGYRSTDFYVYYYGDEISIQTYAYHNNVDFEKILLKYVDNKNLDEFVTNLTKTWKNYDSFKYDKEEGNVYLLYSSRGVEINIKNNNPKGITLYNNYYFTDKTKSLVKNGYVTLNSEEDLINIIETERRNNTLQLY